MSVVFRDEAISDLDDIAQYIAQYIAAAAASVIARIHRVIYHTIDCFHLSGKSNARIRSPWLALPDHLLPVGNVIDVIAVFHTARDPATKRQP